jgi:multiple sugar transport system ATP-binding protein
MAEVQLVQLSKTYPNGVEAVRDLSLTIADGELVVFVGPSGCGKTTTLRLIAGLEEPSGGNVHIGGRSAAGLAAYERNVAIVFQRPALYPHMTVRRNLSFSLRLQNQTKAETEARVDRTAELLGLTGVLERLPRELSGGQQQRVALGRAIVREPSVFLLDEPLSQLDGRLREELRHELHLLQRRLRTTMVYVTHDQAEALSLGDRIVVMERGKVQQVGRPEAVYERPSNRFVAEFLGAPAMNFLEGRLLRENGDTWFLTGAWKLRVSAERVPESTSAMVLGLRPEAICFSAQARSDTLAMEVVISEALGHEWLATLENNGQKLTARLPAHQRAEVGQTAHVVLDMKAAHWFDRSSGMALSG